MFNDAHLCHVFQSPLYIKIQRSLVIQCINRRRIIGCERVQPFISDSVNDGQHLLADTQPYRIKLTILLSVSEKPAAALLPYNCGVISILWFLGYFFTIRMLIIVYKNSKILI